MLVLMFTSRMRNWCNRERASNRSRESGLSRTSYGRLYRPNLSGSTEPHHLWTELWAGNMTGATPVWAVILWAACSRLCRRRSSQTNAHFATFFEHSCELRKLNSSYRKPSGCLEVVFGFHRGLDLTIQRSNFAAWISIYLQCSHISIFISLRVCLSIHLSN